MKTNLSISQNEPTALASDERDATEVKETFVAGFLLLAACFGYLYHHVVARLVQDWYKDDNYSHGFLIVPIALYFVWERRKQLREAPRAPSCWGLAIIGGSMALLLAGILGSELFLTRISILGTIAGSILFLYGWKNLKILMLPIAFLLLMIPIPAIVFNQVAFPLQLLVDTHNHRHVML